jgi:hypothetical protein
MHFGNRGEGGTLMANDPNVSSPSLSQKKKKKKKRKKEEKRKEKKKKKIGSS